MNSPGELGGSRGLLRKLGEELKTLASVTLYFGCWMATLLTIKDLLLEEYQIPLNRMSMAVVGTLVLAKVVLVLEHVSFGAWVRKRPAWVDVLLRTVLYALAVLMVLLLEKAFEGRHEYHGFLPSLFAVSHHADVYHVWVNAICVTGALLSYNLLTVVRRRLGKGGLARLLMSPLPKEPTTG